MRELIFGLGLRLGLDIYDMYVGVDVSSGLGLGLMLRLRLRLRAGLSLQWGLELRVLRLQ